MADRTVQGTVRDDLHLPANGRRRPSGGDAEDDRLVAAWEGILDRLRIPLRIARQLARRARVNNTSFQSELLACGFTSERAHYRALADDLGLEFVDDIGAHDIILRPEDTIAALRGPATGHLAFLHSRTGGMPLLIAPKALDLPTMRGFMRRFPEFATRLRIITPTRLRQALLDRARDKLLGNAREGLFAARPDLSARTVTNSWQGFLIGVLVVSLPVGLLLAPISTVLLLHLCCSLAFLFCVTLRLRVARSLPFAPRAPAPDMDGAEDVPVYSVMVALHDEADVLPDLMAALGKLVWPRSKIEIKLVCEEDDHGTLAALGRMQLRPWVEVVKVPASLPRTKPKALAYALPLVKGRYVALYDAEDRPHPLQLVKAWRRFQGAGDEVACLQAPLAIANHAYGALPFMFRLEYAALFRGLLPWLAERSLVLPLGGTSNHFRRDRLIECGGWDPYNVTEDADLGVRFARLGYRCETIEPPTLEDAPEPAGVWIRQRSRWFKGWMQTWLVHMRDPAALMRDIGPRSFLIVQILFAGMILSALSHPFLLVSAAWIGASLVGTAELSIVKLALLGVDIANVVLGYASFLFLGWRSLHRAERASFWRAIVLTPPYWLLMSLASWRALWQIVRDPFRWEKTPHRRYRRSPSRAPSAARRPAPRLIPAA
ncbi:glycosyltransferase [Mesorhizobium xinjiangense]|uniref:glycosyltransferase n=1 Tax=Mesorhizobium xinjiangense TaxID=2678685 RepID=UPI0012ED358B|nr:glycosyltransferase [Mesorhizobium xinjiangense]